MVGGVKICGGLKFVVTYAYNVAAKLKEEFYAK